MVTYGATNYGGTTAAYGAGNTAGYGYYAQKYNTPAAQDYSPLHGVTTPSLRPQTPPAGRPNGAPYTQPSHLRYTSAASRWDTGLDNTAGAQTPYDATGYQSPYAAASINPRSPRYGQKQQQPLDRSSSYMRPTAASLIKSKGAASATYDPPTSTLSRDAYDRRAHRALDSISSSVGAPPDGGATSPRPAPQPALDTSAKPPAPRAGAASPGRQAATAAAPAGCFIPAQAAEDNGKYTIVFDLDETLVHARDGPVRQRPHAQKLLRGLNGLAEVVLWTAGERSYAMNALRALDASGTVKHIVARDPRWCRGFTGGTKDLKKLGRDRDRTIIIENTAECVRANPDHAILVPDFNGGSCGVLGYLDGILHELIRSEKSVPEFLRESQSCVPTKCRTPAGEALTVCAVSGFTPTDAAPAAVASVGGYRGYGAYSSGITA